MDRISSRKESVTEPPKQRTPPADTGVSDKAAADFAALVGADDQKSTSKTKATSDAFGSEASEPQRHDPDRRVEQRSNERESSSGGDGRDSKDGERGSGEKRGEGEAEPVVSLGDTILRALTRGSEVTAAAGPQLARDATMDGVVQQIVDKILVSEPTTGQREVRIILKESVMPGTEVRLTQNAGKLQVQFVSESQKSLDLLQQNQQSLQQRLSEKLDKHDVVVEIEMDGQGQPDQDGRSRQRQEITEEDND